MPETETQRDDEIAIGEVTKTVRTLVYADVAQVIAENAEHRAKYDGSDLDYVKDWLRTEAYEFLEHGTDGGWRVEGEFDDVEVTFYV